MHFTKQLIDFTKWLVGFTKRMMGFNKWLANFDEWIGDSHILNLFSFNSHKSYDTNTYFFAILFYDSDKKIIQLISILFLFILYKKYFDDNLEKFNEAENYLEDILIKDKNYRKFSGKQKNKY